jgi:hypothetical protein
LQKNKSTVTINLCNMMGNICCLWIEKLGTNNVSEIIIIIIIIIIMLSVMHA